MPSDIPDPSMCKDYQRDLRGEGFIERSEVVEKAQGVLEEIKAMTSQDNILDLISIPTLAIIGFIVIYSYSLTGGI